MNSDCFSSGKKRDSLFEALNLVKSALICIGGVHSCVVLCYVDRSRNYWGRRNLVVIFICTLTDKFVYSSCVANDDICLHIEVLIFISKI